MNTLRGSSACGWNVRKADECEPLTQSNCALPLIATLLQVAFDIDSCALKVAPPPALLQPNNFPCPDTDCDDGLLPTPGESRMSSCQCMHFTTSGPPESPAATPTATTHEMGSAIASASSSRPMTRTSLPYLGSRRVGILTLRVKFIERELRE